jgi:hypothetical protein
MTWTIEAELTKLTGCDFVAEALVQLGLLKFADEKFEIREIAAWRRGGAETYIFEFTVTSSGGTRHLVLKACVAFGVATTLANIFDEWLRRRSLLEQAGIETPALFAAANGVLIEEHIRWNLWDYISQYPAELDRVVEVARYAGLLARLRFQPVDAFSDLRTRGLDVVAIDFGDDLGPPNVAAYRDEALLVQLHEFLRRRDISIDANLVRAVEAAYAETLAEPS